MAIPDGLSSDALDRILSKAAKKGDDLDASLSSLSSSQRDTYTDAESLWPQRKSNKDFNEEMQNAIKDVAAIRKATETTATAATYITQDYAITAKKDPTEDDLLKLGAPSSLGFLYLGRQLGKGSSDGTSAAAGKMLDLLKTAGLAGGAVALLASLSPMLQNAMLDADIIKNSPEIKAARKEYLLTYTEAVSAKKAELIEGWGGSLVAGASVVGSAVGEAFGEAITGLATALGDVKVILTDQEFIDARRDFLLAKTGLLSGAELTMLDTGGASFIAAMGIAGEAVGKLAGGFVTQLGSAFFDVAEMASNEDIKKARGEFLLKKVALLQDAEIDMLKPVGEGGEGGALLITVAGLTGDMLGKLGGGFVSSLAQAFFDTETIATDEDIKTARKNFLLEKLDIMQSAEIEALTEDGWAKVTAVSSSVGSTIGALVGGYMETMAGAVINSAVLATDPDVAKARKQFLLDKVKVLQEAELAMAEGGGKWAIATTKTLGEILAGPAAGFMESLANSFMNIDTLVELQNDEQMKKMRVDFALEKAALILDAEMQFEDSKFGKGMRTVANIAKSFGEIIASPFSGYLESLSSMMYNVEDLRHHPELEGKRLELANLYLDEILAENNRAKGGLGDSVKSFFAGIATTMSASSRSQARSATAADAFMDLITLRSSDAESAVVKDYVAKEYLAALEQADLKRFVTTALPSSTSFAKNIIASVTSQPIEFDFEAAGVKVQKTALANRYLRALTDYKIDRIEELGKLPLADEEKASITEAFVKGLSPLASPVSFMVEGGIGTEEMLVTANVVNINAGTVSTEIEEVEESILLEDNRFESDVVEALKTIVEALTREASPGPVFQPEISQPITLDNILARPPLAVESL